MIRFLASYITWHYSRAYKELYEICRNLLWFVAHLFSIKGLLHTLFSPWHQLGERYKRGFDIEALFSTLIVNVIMRFVGFLVRGAVIIVGLFFCILTILASLLAFLFWTLYPLVLLFLFVSSFKLLFG